MKITFVRRCWLLLLTVVAVTSQAAEPVLTDPQLDTTDTASIARGAHLYADYCSRCHTMRYQRYQRIAHDLDLPKQQVADWFHVPLRALKSHMDQQYVPAASAREWFGQTAPDLTLIANVRGTDWLYTFLKGFYQDDSQPFGVNNIVLPQLNMPHVLENLGGLQTPKAGEQAPYLALSQLQLVRSGQLNEDEYDATVRDLVNFLNYASDPNILQRENLGYWVLGFLLLFTVLAFLLKREFWRDVH